MRIDTHFDLRVAWLSSTILGKIFYFWLMLIGWVVLFLTTVYITSVTEFGAWSGFLRFNDESKENKEAD